MRREEVAELFQRIPPIDVPKAVLCLRSGLGITVDYVYRLEPTYVVVRGREAGTNDDGRGFVHPYEDISYVKIDRPLKVNDLRKMYGDPLVEGLRRPGRGRRRPGGRPRGGPEGGRGHGHGPGVHRQAEPARPHPGRPHPVGREEVTTSPANPERQRRGEGCPGTAAVPGRPHPRRAGADGKTQEPLAGVAKSGRDGRGPREQPRR